MVYCGKPSKGCSNCRERKIRCDQREPGCGQCEKRSQECPGYRNLMDLMFRDESSHVIKKATAQARKGSVASSIKTTPSPTTPVSQPSRPTQLTWSPNETIPVSSRRGSLARKSPSSSTFSAESPSSLPSQFGFINQFELSPVALRSRKNSINNFKQEPKTPSFADFPAPIALSYSPSFEDRGLNLFIARYIEVSANACQNKFDFIFDFWKPPTSPVERTRDPVMASVTAVGLLGVAQMSQGQGPLFDAAHKAYGQALRLTNAALRSTPEAVKDTTMLSVLLLAMYETMMGSDRGMHAWQQHINGAAALAKVRGVGQFRTRAGVRMFMMHCTNTMANCIQNGLPMPQDLIDLRGKLIASLGGPQALPGHRICPPIYKILQLKYDIKQGHVTDLDEMLDKFNEAEDDFEAAVSLFPESWHYRKYHLPQRLRPGFFNNVCHVYPNNHIGTVWNGLRTCRMLILETMLEELHKRFQRVPVEQVPPQYQIQNQKARYKMERIALAILASVPQHFGLVSPSDGSLDTMAPVPSVEDAALETSDSSNWEILLGECDASSDDEDQDFCQSPSLSNPMMAQGPQASAERFMLLASVTNSLVWPLYVVGMSEASSSAMKAFVIERLHAVHSETGLAQARKLADIVAGHRQSQERRSRFSPSARSRRYSGPYFNKQDRRATSLPV